MALPVNPDRAPFLRTSRRAPEYVIAQSAVGAEGAVAVEGEGGGGTVNSFFTAAAGSQGRQARHCAAVHDGDSIQRTLADPWNSDTGGVLAVDIENTLTLGGNVDVSGLGSRGVHSRKGR